MTKTISTLLLVLLASSQVLAAELTPSNLIGRYNVQANAGFQKIYVKFRVVNTTEFEVQRTYPDGHSDELCNGDYQLNSNIIYWDDIIIARNKRFHGTVSCPSDRSKTYDFDIDFANKTTDDLAKGTNVSLSVRGFTVSAYVKKQ